MEELNKKPTPNQLLWELYNTQKELIKYRDFATKFRLLETAGRIIIIETLKDLVGDQDTYADFHDALVEYCEKNNPKSVKGTQRHHVVPRRKGKGTMSAAKKTKTVNVTNLQHNLFHYLLGKIHGDLEEFRCVKIFRTNKGEKRSWQDNNNIMDTMVIGDELGTDETV